jgi:hypothetical protein
MTATIAGAWELMSEAEHGLIVATDTHVSVIIARKDRPAVRDPDAPLTSPTAPSQCCFLPEDVL